MSAATFDEVLQVLRTRRDEARAIEIELVGADLVFSDAMRPERRHHIERDLVHS